MATEILNLEVKSNIKGAVTEVDKLTESQQGASYAYAELTENVKLQNEFITAQEDELIRLKAIQDSIPDGAWWAGQSQLNEEIKQVTSTLRTEKQELKKLTKEHRDSTKAIRDNTSEQKKNTNAAIRGIQHYQIMGVSIRKLKFMIRGVIPMFKLLFGTIKSGIASTGIGVLILALISIGTAMKKSVAGGKAFKVMMDGIGKVTDIIIGSLTFLGDLMLSVFGFDSSTSAAVTAANNLEQAYKDLGKEMDGINKKEAQKGRQQAENSRQADDESLTEKQRIAAAIRNYGLEQDTNKDRLNNFKKTKKANEESIKLQKQIVEQAKKDEEGVKEAIEEQDKLLKNLNNTEIQLAKLRTKLDQDRVDIGKKIDQIKQTQIDKDKKAAADAEDRSEKRKQKRIQDAKEVATAETTLAKQIQKIKDELQYESLETQTEVNKAKIQNTYDRAKAEIESSIASQETIDAALLELKLKYNGDLAAITAESDILLAELKAESDLLKIDDERALADKKLEIQRDAEIASVAGMEKEEELKAAIKDKYSKIQGKTNKKRGEDDKAISKASTNDQIAAFGDLAGALSSLAGDNKELAAGEAIISTYVGANKAFAQGGVAGYVGAAAIILSGLANVKKIYATDVGGGGGGGAAAATASAAPPAPQMMSGSFDLTGGQEAEPVQAFVVSDDITESQNGLAIIRRRATI